MSKLALEINLLEAKARAFDMIEAEATEGSPDLNIAPYDVACDVAAMIRELRERRPKAEAPTVAVPVTPETFQVRITKGNVWYQDCVGEIITVMVDPQIPYESYHLVEAPPNGCQLPLWIPQNHCEIIAEPEQPEADSALCVCGHSFIDHTFGGDECYGVRGGCLCREYRPAAKPPTTCEHIRPIIGTDKTGYNYRYSKIAQPKLNAEDLKREPEKSEWFWLKATSYARDIAVEAEHAKRHAEKLQDTKDYRFQVYSNNPNAVELKPIDRDIQNRKNWLNDNYQRIQKRLNAIYKPENKNE